MLPALTGIPWKTPHVRFWEGENRVLGGGCCTRRSREGRVSKASAFPTLALPRHAHPRAVPPIPAALFPCPTFP